MSLIMSNALDMLVAFFSRCQVKHLSVIFTMLAFLFVVVGSVSAQSHQKSNPSHLRDGPESPQEVSPPASPSNLPDWAESSQSGDGYSTSGRLGSGVQKNAAPSNLSAAPPKSQQKQQELPVDGGLALLAAAGAGYAVRKLKEDEEGDGGLPA